MGIFLLFCKKIKQMQTTLLFIGATLLFISCSKKESKENLHITGNIEGFKKGTVYIQKVKNDTILEPIDTIKINGDSHFVSDINLKEPEMLYLFIDRGVSCLLYTSRCV